MGFKSLQTKGNLVFFFFFFFKIRLYFVLISIQKTQGSYGGPVWAIVRNPLEEEIGVGCEDGCIRLFSVDSNDITLKKSFPRQKGRVLSLSWKSHSPDEIVSGGEGSIRLWKIKTSQSTIVIDVPYRHAKTPLVWCVSYLR